MDAVSRSGLDRRCKVCGDVVAADRTKVRAGLTVRHHVTVLMSDTKPLCKGSKIRYDEQPDRREPWPPSPPRSGLIARRSGPGAVVTFVDFREAARERALGHATEREHALRYVKLVIRDA